MVLIQLEVPEWAEGRHIYIFAGREVVARKLIDKPFEIKTVRCNLCGECCHHVSSSWPFGRNEEGACAKLKYERVKHADGRIDEGYFCRASGPIVPFTCCKGRGMDPELCCVRFKVVFSLYNPQKPSISSDKSSRIKDL